jgi:hypothetical protein
MPVFDADDAIAARDHLVIIAQRDTGQSRRVANFLLAWRNAGDCGGVDLTDLWMVDRAIADDSLTVARLISIRYEYPTEYGYGPQLERLVADWRPRPFERPVTGHA